MFQSPPTSDYQKISEIPFQTGHTDFLLIVDCRNTAPFATNCAQKNRPFDAALSWKLTIRHKKNKQGIMDVYQHSCGKAVFSQIHHLSIGHVHFG